MKNCKLFFSFLVLGAWASAEDGDVVEVANVFEADALDSRIVITAPCFTNSKTPVSCIGVGKDRLMPHPDDCHLFYQCAHMWPLCHECPANLHFNPVEHVCDYPEVAGCTLSSS